MSLVAPRLQLQLMPKKPDRVSFRHEARADHRLAFQRVVDIEAACSGRELVPNDHVSGPSRSHVAAHDGQSNDADQRGDQASALAPLAGIHVASLAPFGVGVKLNIAL